MNRPIDSEPEAETLRDCREGEHAVIVRVGGTGAFRRRLMEMGFLPGEKIQIVKFAPLRDPVEFIVKGYHVSLRREEAEHVVVERCRP